MQYRIVYDVLQQPFDWTFVLGELSFALIGLLVLVGARPASIVTGHSCEEIRIFASIFLVFALMMSVTDYFYHSSNYKRYHTMAQTGACALVEGPVENFVPMPYEGHASEHFTVRGVKYRYSDFAETGAFNQTSSHGGPIHEGLYVRICSIGDDEDDNRILRLEIRQ